MTASQDTDRTANADTSAGATSGAASAGTSAAAAAPPAAATALLSGWGRTAPSRARLVPVADPAGAVAALADALRAGGGRGAIARGLGRSYGDAAQNAGGEVLAMTGLRAVETFDARTGTITAQAGVSLAELIATTLPHGWFPAVTPGTAHVTIGGAIAADVHGKNHHVEGSFTRHVEAFDLLTPDGRVRTVTPGDDVFAATAGGMGLTGVVLRATLRLLPAETGLVRVDTERGADVDDVMARMVRDDHRYRYSVAWIDGIARGRRLGRGVLTRGDHATAAELPQRGRRPFGRGGRAAPDGAADAHGGAASGASTLPGERPTGPGTARIAVPQGLPSGLLRPAALRAFNAAYFHAAPREVRCTLEPIGGFFYPLDVVRDWNRAYGPRGFVQYQFVVPDAAGETVRALLERIAGSRSPALLIVLKRFGAGNGWLSFPAPGWTVALDIPVGDPDLAALLDTCDEDVAAAGGRVYLAKDSRLRPELLAAMYPDLDRWRAVQQRLDPDGVLRSDLARRLGLVAGGA